MAAARLVLAWLLVALRTVTWAEHLEPGEDELNETVICTNDYMEVIIPSAFFLSKMPPVYTSDDTHIMFINSIHNNDTDVITRNYVNITFVCRYPINYLVQQPNGENMIRVDVRTITLNTEDGNFSVSMSLYKDGAFENRWTTVPSLTLDDEVFVKVFMMPANLMLRIERCWATPTSDPYSNIQYTFIRDRSAATPLKAKSLDWFTCENV
ncbi:unnamed protein product [Tetraodon nigroviridis]|uniref:(spotted green pufferfish) hypothetical protein n=1 Tax=Tetraodon nigroviridis TaxID=99883 RepID=Q4REJ0_TETNG|nr:unnamed protein product [Tetraodon nigroviridis]